MSQTIRISSRIIDSDIHKTQALSTVHRESLNGSVEDIETGDGGCTFEGVGVEEFRLGFTAIAAFAVPPFGPIGVNRMTRGAGDFNVSP